MSGLRALARSINAINEGLGRAVAWLALVMVVLQFAVVVMRYVFGISSLYIQESIVYMHAVIFLVAAGYTLLHDGHVRIDIFYGGASVRTKAWINLLGVIFLLWPMTVFTAVISWDYVRRSWRVLEGSPEGTAGLPFVYLLKTMILLFAGTLFLQGISLLIRSIETLRENAAEVRVKPVEEGPKL